MKRHILSLCFVVVITPGVVVPVFAASEPMGFVLGVKGAPMTTEASGMTRRAKALEDIHDGEMVILEHGDTLTICDPVLGSFEVRGPGTVRLGSPTTALAGSPQITRHGSCEDSVTTDGNGGVILRYLGLHGKPQTVVGQ